MIRRWILGLMGCVLCMNVLAQSLYYTQEDSLRCVQILKELQKDSSCSFGIRVLHAAQKFLGTPYQSATLEKNPEGIVVNFRQLDCTTFVEIVLALAYEAKEDNPDFNGLADYLRLMRYRNGEISYLNRLHYFSDWLYENQVRGMIMDKTATISRSVPLQLNLSFMSSHPESYPALKAHPDWVGKMQEIESVINKRNSYSYLPKEYIEEVSSKIEDGDYSTYAQANLMVTDWINNYNTLSREISTSASRNEIRFGDEKIKDRIRDVLKRLGSTSSIIITGLQMFNEMLSPGLRPEKLYVLLGLPGGFKSAMLLKLGLDCIKYNSKSYRPKDPSCKPAALYITLENTNEESFARAYNMLCTADDIENHNVDEIYDSMKDSGVLMNPNMDFIMLYRPNMSISTRDVRNYIDDYKSQGIEICLLIVDYIGRIHSEQRAANEKEELKNVTNELKNIAVDYFIPVATAHQGNRAGLSVANAAKREGKSDIGKLLDSEYTGSAIEVLQNADMQLFIYLERRVSDGRLFLSFNRSKERYRPQSKLSYFCQPFDVDNEIKLVDDIFDEKPAGIVALSNDMEQVDTDLLLGQKNRHNRYSFPNMTKGTKTEDTFDLKPLSSN